MLKIINGEVYDPVHGINGEVRDICVENGRIAASVSGGTTIDASGMVVMPGGVDMHAHIAGPKVNSARKLRPEDHRLDPVPRTSVTRSGAGKTIPSTFTTGYRYAAMGYTTAFDAAVPPIAARHAHEEFIDTPVIDKGFFVLMGNNEFIMQQIAAGERERMRHYVAWLLRATKGYGVKLVNPGGVELWKFGGNAHGLDDHVDGFNVTPRQIIRELAEAAMELRLPHAMHIHCNNLGVAGNWETTLETMKALDGRNGHFAHIQFHSYGGRPGGLFTSRVPELAEYVNTHPNLTVDVGQVLFGDTTSMTGDGPLAYMLHQISGRKWINMDVENEEGCGIVPVEYKDKNYVHATQWAIGLEWFLLIRDPWRIALSTDHPNGASFVAYPQIIALLMDREFRREALKKVNPKAIAKTCLPDHDREYSLFEIAIITRAAPARILGLKNKGHLGVGADADVTIYEKSKDKEKMFSSPRYVIKGGQVLVEEGQIRRETYGRTLYVSPRYDPAVEKDIREFFDKYYTIEFENYPVQLEHYLPYPQEIATNESATATSSTGDGKPETGNL
ncbi:MAG TPA: formylmethanofuran dehydrogenase subunit A [Acidobacteriota bacterium]|nr:formylmethanofuran dehydrogenase subunit A [Acidobacteriota bacterium]